MTEQHEIKLTMQNIVLILASIMGDNDGMSAAGIREKDLLVRRLCVLLDKFDKQ